MKLLPAIILLATATILPPAPATAATAGLVKQEHPLVKDLEDRQGEDFEAMFLAFMIHHSRFGIRMTGLADERGADAALKQWAVTAIETQKREIVQMDQWLAQWHPRKPGEDQVPQTLLAKEQQILDELGKTKDANFDKLFAARLRAHRDTAVAMARLAADRAIHEEVKDFAHRMVELKGQQRE